MKSTLPRYLAAACATLAFTCTVSFAEDPKPEKEHAKEKAPSKAALEKYDANKDGQLDDAEKAAMKADQDAKHEVAKQARLAKYDTNHDGKIDKDEKAIEDADKEKAKAEKEKAKAEKQAAKEAKKAEATKGADKQN